jgi:hypothetical protein
LGGRTGVKRLVEEEGVASVRANRGVDNVGVRLGIAALVADLANERRT